VSPTLTPRTKPERETLRASLPVHLSIGIMAWNEEDVIRATLESLFRQSVFEKLGARRRRCEIFCIANGCTDRTVEVAREVFARITGEHPHAEMFTARVVEIEEPGRSNAWNRFVHDFSAPEAKFICLMDADILFHERDTLLSLVETLEVDDHAWVSTGRHYKDIYFKKHKTLRDRISLATSAMTGTIAGGFSGQLYCLRSTVVRNIRLPRDLAANDDGFLKAVICTDFLTAESDTTRIIQAPDAAIVYEAYVSLGEIMNNQKRQMIGQTTVHVLIEYLKSLPVDARARLADTIKANERRDPRWFMKLNEQHIQETRFFWQLFPGILTFRFKRLLKLPGLKKLTHAPAALVGFVVTLISCWRAFRYLKSDVSPYWPKPSRQSFLNTPGFEVK
jgi:glycosyltransferase involved in cell wall biosynthesis